MRKTRFYLGSEKYRCIYLFTQNEWNELTVSVSIEDNLTGNIIAKYQWRNTYFLAQGYEINRIINNNNDLFHYDSYAVYTSVNGKKEKLYADGEGNVPREIFTSLNIKAY